MSKQVLEAWNFSTLEELWQAVNSAVVMASAEDHHSSTVYAENAGRMTLVEETLTDGSKVLNLFVFPAPKQGSVAA